MSILKIEELSLKSITKILPTKDLNRLCIEGVDPTLNQTEKDFISWALKELFAEKKSLLSLHLKSTPECVIDILTPALLNSKSSVNIMTLQSLPLKTILKLTDIFKEPNKVTNLDLNSFDEDLVKAVANIVKEDNCIITSLRLTSLDENAVKAVPNIIKEPNCKVTTLALTLLNENAVKAVPNIIKEPNCKVTTLALRLLDENAVKAVPNIFKELNCKVTTLILAFLKESAVKAVLSIIKEDNCKITALALTGLDENAVKAVPNILKENNCKVTTFRLSSLKENSVKAALEILEDPSCKITSLELQYLSDKAWEAVVEFVKKPSCRIKLIHLETPSSIPFEWMMPIAEVCSKKGISLTGAINNTWARPSHLSMHDSHLTAAGSSARDKSSKRKDGNLDERPAKKPRLESNSSQSTPNSDRSALTSAAQLASSSPIFTGVVASSSAFSGANFNIQNLESSAFTTRTINAQPAHQMVEVKEEPAPQNPGLHL